MPATRFTGSGMARGSRGIAISNAVAVPISSPPRRLAGLAVDYGADGMIRS